MKKLLCLLLTLAMTFSLAACGSKADDKTPEEDDPTQAETPVDEICHPRCTCSRQT